VVRFARTALSGAHSTSSADDGLRSVGVASVDATPTLRIFVRGESLSWPMPFARPEPPEANAAIRIRPLRPNCHRCIHTDLKRGPIHALHPAWRNLTVAEYELPALVAKRPLKEP